MGPVQMIFVSPRALLRSQGELAAENLALRQQLAVGDVWLSARSGRPSASVAASGCV